MSDGIRCRIWKDPYTDNIEFTFLERVDGRTSYIWRPDGHGYLERVAMKDDGSREQASLVFGEEQGKAILETMAQQLAQMGFVQLNAAPQMVAMKEHLNDMRVNAERLFTLANKGDK